MGQEISDISGDGAPRDYVRQGGGHTYVAQALTDTTLAPDVGVCPPSATLSGPAASFAPACHFGNREQSPRVSSADRTTQLTRLALSAAVGRESPKLGQLVKSHKPGYSDKHGQSGDAA